MGVVATPFSTGVGDGPGVVGFAFKSCCDCDVIGVGTDGLSLAAARGSVVSIGSGAVGGVFGLSELEIFIKSLKYIAASGR